MVLQGIAALEYTGIRTAEETAYPRTYICSLVFRVYSLVFRDDEGRPERAHALGVNFIRLTILLAILEVLRARSDPTDVCKWSVELFFWTGEADHL